MALIRTHKSAADTLTPNELSNDLNKRGSLTMYSKLPMVGSSGKRAGGNFVVSSLGLNAVENTQNSGFMQKSAHRTRILNLTAFTLLFIQSPRDPEINISKQQVYYQQYNACCGSYG